MAEYEDKLERMLADGRLTLDDADEVRNFAAFLTASAGISTRAERRSPEEHERWLEIYAEHYPEDFQRGAPALYAATMKRIEERDGHAEG